MRADGPGLLDVFSSSLVYPVYISPGPNKQGRPELDFSLKAKVRLSS